MAPAGACGGRADHDGHGHRDDGDRREGPPAEPRPRAERPRIRPPASKLKLIASLPSITLPRHGKTVYLDPDIWLATLGAPFQIDAVRASYTQPVQAFEIVNGHRRLLPSWVLDGWGGLRNFIQLQVRNTHGKVVASRTLNFCLNTYEPSAPSPPAPPPRRTRLPAASRTRSRSARSGASPGAGKRTRPTSWAPFPGRAVPPPSSSASASTASPRASRRALPACSVPAKDRTSTVTVHVGGTPTCSPACGRSSASARRPRHVTRAVPSAPASVPRCPASRPMRCPT